VFRGRPITEGTLFAKDEGGRDLGPFPLKHTEVRGEVSGFLASVDVAQEYENRFDVKVEAVYVFPLPSTAAVGDFVLTIGDRTIRGVVREKEEARRVYEDAKARGLTASLLSEERPNVFTQELANLEPGHCVTVSLRYADCLRMRDGAFEFAFPTVVAPRYVPGAPSPAAPTGTGFSRDTDRVPDGSRVTPPVAPPGTRPGHDISISLSIDAGLPIVDVSSPTHEVVVERPDANRAEVCLKDLATIPNRDFVVRYRVAGDDTRAGAMFHRGDRGGFFALFLVPPQELSDERATPREVIFLLDTSGSMAGEPMEKSKATVLACLHGLRSFDTFRVVRFAGDSSALSPDPLPATPENLSAAASFIEGFAGGGGTEMLRGIVAALDPPVEEGRLRVVCFLTDGCIGNETEIIAAVREKSERTRVFALGVGSSVNRYLLEGVACEGHGEVVWVLPSTAPEVAAAAFAGLVDSPCLADVAVDFGGLPVTDVCPDRISDLRPGSPVLIVGRCDGGGSAVVTVRGISGGGVHSVSIPVTFPDWEERHEVLAWHWARARIAALLSRDLRSVSGATRTEAIRLALDFGIVCPYTSFTAVDESRATAGGPAVRVAVPVHLPEGVSYRGVFGDHGDFGELHPLGMQFEAGESGLRVTRVEPGSAAEAAGIATGDLLVRVNGIEVRSGLAAEKEAERPSDEVAVDFRRDGVLRSVVFRVER
jgi:Ca-activated chloride channel family protein